VALGRIAHDTRLKMLKLQRDASFAHGAVPDAGKLKLYDAPTDQLQITQYRRADASAISAACSRGYAKT